MKLTAFSWMMHGFRINIIIIDLFCLQYMSRYVLIHVDAAFPITYLVYSWN